MARSIEELEILLCDVGEIYENLDRIFNKTEIFFRYFKAEGYIAGDISSLELSEIYSDFSAARLFFQLKPDFQNSDFTSFFSFWESLYLSLVERIGYQGSGISTINSKYENFANQYTEFVKPMILQRLETAKKDIAYKKNRS